MNKTIRTFHRQVSPWIFALLIVSATTGMIYRLGRAWFGMTKPTGNAVLHVHTGEWISPAIAPYYMLVVGGGLLALLITGSFLLWQSRAKKGARAWHRWLGLVFLLPLTATAVTGVACGLDGVWYSLPKETENLLMSIHEGGWLGKTYKPFYVLVLGLGTLGLGGAGLRLTGLFRRKSHE